MQKYEDEIRSFIKRNERMLYEIGCEGAECASERHPNEEIATYFDCIDGYDEIIASGRIPQSWRIAYFMYVFIQRCTIMMLGESLRYDEVIRTCLAIVEKYDGGSL